jgi:hypothetical protein
MISTPEAGFLPSESTSEESPVRFVVLARYGRVPQVARFHCSEWKPERGDSIVVKTERGEELASTLLTQPTLPRQGQDSGEDEDLTGEVVRRATDEDLLAIAELQLQADDVYLKWQQLASEKKLQLEIIDAEYTLSRRLVLYVLNGRGAETTRLALLAAASGYGVINVQPVSAEGIVIETEKSESGGCSSGSCGCSTKKS